MLWRNIYRLYTTVLGNTRMSSWATRAIWTKISSKGGGTFLHFPSFLLRRSYFFVSVWPHRRVRIDTGIAFYFPKGRWVNSAEQRSQKRAEANVRRPFAELVGRLPTGPRGWKGDGSDASQFPQSTRYERFPPGEYHCRSSARSFTFRWNGTMYKMLIKFFITP